MASPLPASLPLGQVQLGTSLTDILVVPDYPPSVIVEIDCIWVANTDAAAHTATLRYGTGTLTVANSLGEAWAMLANESFILGVGSVLLRLTAGMKLQGLADAASKITVSVFGTKSGT